MPELPEVETIKRELEAVILDKRITAVVINNAKVIREPKKEKFVANLKNVAIKKIIRKGKLLIFELSSGKFLTIHLKMTGQLIYPSHQKRGGGVNPGKISRVSFRFFDNTLLDFNDSRLFGELRIVDDWQKLKFIKELGPEPFDIDAEKFKEMLASKKTKIKVSIMDQKFISGIGNLYANEALFRAKIHPQRPTNSLSEKEKELLFKEIKDVLLEAIHYGGSSVDQYVQVSGKPGEYVKYHKVYDREGEPCFNCGGKVERISLGSRGTYFCPACQRLKRS
ncbi:MAG: DNA-formamidopyrimidine glycosylase [Candidatus Portnoybacteria bacterium RBG_13_40_8]|uniref:Formamidopyrimidine-DNA glycosylase n=1 Tax=Candidatus Portnoybacteria bacterium RBG_13_40_8 TaxID=1801990 RepID=A0A1G2F2W3_9BACT|nr:MAG: DNA-formamidopyrimidine glycosylase [Candidatus Portnoybacteria bacterium RBG_13_40_8]OGZ34814.1 MAG: DNA-formamidopyrimidine glycosylase [Candidatus Portnoybacteria bacterium RIFCSPHIGHO2_01_FULL_39_19]